MNIAVTPFSDMPSARGFLSLKVRTQQDVLHRMDRQMAQTEIIKKNSYTKTNKCTDVKIIFFTYNLS